MIIKRSARAILLDGDDWILIRRTKPGLAPYWVAVGGGVEDTDASVEDALHREVFEEVGGTLIRAEPVLVITDRLDRGIGIQHIFAARLRSMDVSARTGAEFSMPGRGEYEIVRLPLTEMAVRGINLMPPRLADFVATNIDGIMAVLDGPPLRGAAAPD